MPTTTTFDLGVTARLHILPSAYFHFVVAVASDPAHAIPDITPVRMSALLTHEEGLTQPDDMGWVFARAVVERGGTALRAFATLAAALTFRARLVGGAQ